MDTRLAVEDLLVVVEDGVLEPVLVAADEREDEVPADEVPDGLADVSRSIPGEEEAADDVSTLPSDGLCCPWSCVPEPEFSLDGRCVLSMRMRSAAYSALPPVGL